MSLRARLTSALVVLVALSATGPLRATVAPAAARMSTQTGDSAALADAAAGVLASLTQTHYTHRSHIDAAKGIYFTDCSGFVSYLLDQVAPAQEALVPKGSSSDHPLAFRYEQFFASLAAGQQAPGWVAVPRLADARPGDIIAWANLPLQPGQDTGHVMVVAAPPVPQPDGTLLVTVYDATGTRHYEDTRPPGGSGVGRGALRFRVDASGKPVAYQFAPGASFRTPPIAIGRLIGDGTGR